MYGIMETEIKIKVPTVIEMDTFVSKNISELMVSEFDENISSTSSRDPDYEEKFITDVWVGIVLSLLVLSCSACICSCFLYHKFQMWKRRELEARTRAAQINSLESGDRESLPSYTVVSGLPTYEEALSQLNDAKRSAEIGNNLSISPSPLAKLSATDLLTISTIYKNPTEESDKS